MPLFVSKLMQRQQKQYWTDLNPCVSSENYQETTKKTSAMVQ